jgi:5-methylcytosine-specific restriction protein B
MIPNNITKEHLEKAIEEINRDGIRKGRHSSTYDLIHNGKTYPPKLVLSIANRYANNSELDSNDFAGGKGTEAFQLLENEGFIIVEKAESKHYEIIREYLSVLKSGKIKIANSIKSLIAKNDFENNLKVIDQIFFDNKLKVIDSNNYSDTIDFLKEQHKITSGKYNDFNIWSASKTYLKQRNQELIVRHDELNNKVGFPDNGNGLYKSFLGEKNLISFIKDKYENVSASTKRYWLYAPGANASKWAEFYENGIIGLGWDEIGDLTQYSSRNEIKKALIEAYGGSGSKKNDVSANFDFLNKIKIGDIIIAKKGRGELLGYGIVTSNYEFDNKREEYQNLRQVDWQLKGNWKVDFSLVLKTLTDITKYPSDHPDYSTYYERLLGIMGQNNKIEKIEDMKFPLNTILYGPPGTGKTYNTILRAAQIIENRDIVSYNEALQVFKANLHNRIEFITFHQNYSYEDFIQGLRPDTENDNQLTFERKDGVFKEIADKALKNLTESEKPELLKREFVEVFNQFINPIVEGKIEEIEVKMKKVSFFITAISNKSIDFRKASGGSGHTLSIGTLKKMYLAESVIEMQGLTSYYTPLLAELLKLGKDSSGKTEKIKRKNYVIIIDEINRANISRVFGELITLIEPDKRSHGSIPLEARLPSGDTFIVPSNLFIIGTMNTADKSIALLDIALRRRFEFESMYPLYEIDDQEIYDVAILKKINTQIIKSKGHDFQIGHAYFMGENNDLIERMNKKVIPLLLEYYMNDEKEVKGILNTAGLKIEADSWPLKISGKND